MKVVERDFHRCESIVIEHVFNFNFLQRYAIM